MNKETKKDYIYMSMALLCSKRSYAVRRQVGAIIVRDNRVISDGYNGTPSGFPNVCEEPVKPNSDYEDGKYFGEEEQRFVLYKLKVMEGAHAIKTLPYVLHAEANAILKLTRHRDTAQGATLYVTDEPCIECSKLIIQSGIKEVKYLRPYRLHDGIELLKTAGIVVEHLDNVEYLKEMLKYEEE